MYNHRLYFGIHIFLVEILRHVLCLHDFYLFRRFCLGKMLLTHQDLAEDPKYHNNKLPKIENENFACTCSSTMFCSSSFSTSLLVMPVGVIFLCIGLARISPFFFRFGLK